MWIGILYHDIISMYFHVKRIEVEGEECLSCKIQLQKIDLAMKLQRTVSFAK
jgi:hypothetical protein